MPARQASSCVGQLGMGLHKQPAIGGPTRLEIGHVAVQDARQLPGRVGRWRLLQLVGAGGQRLVCDRVGLGHLRLFP